MKSKYNIEELKEKIDKCRNVKLEDITLDDCLTRVVRKFI